jgi:hypothetical protein
MEMARDQVFKNAKKLSAGAKDQLDASRKRDAKADTKREKLLDKADKKLARAEKKRAKDVRKTERMARKDRARKLAARSKMRNARARNLGRTSGRAGKAPSGRPRKQSRKLRMFVGRKSRAGRKSR